jgi:transposase
MDMTGNYKSLVKKLCPNADVTVDRFHVTKMIHEELNQARIEQKKAASSLKAKERAKLLESLKGNKYTLLKAENDLSSQQKLNLKQVKDASPLVGSMHLLKEDFHTLFEKTNCLGDGILELTDWLKKAQPYYKKSVETIKRWLGEIGGYFESRQMARLWRNRWLETDGKDLSILQRLQYQERVGAPVKLALHIYGMIQGGRGTVLCFR